MFILLIFIDHYTEKPKKQFEFSIPIRMSVMHVNRQTLTQRYMFTLLSLYPSQ